jgi:hypothetical protein
MITFLKFRLIYYMYLYQTRKDILKNRVKES